MEARAISRYIHQSPRKIRIVLNEVRGQRVGDALDYLHFSPVKAAQIIEKTVRSAAANLIHIAEEANVDADDQAFPSCVTRKSNANYKAYQPFNYRSERRERRRIIYGTKNTSARIQTGSQ